MFFGMFLKDSKMCFLLFFGDFWAPFWSFLATQNDRIGLSFTIFFSEGLRDRSGTTFGSMLE
jgi:hypothetical protein